LVWSAMSALGQKLTSTEAKAMSAFGRKADVTICARTNAAFDNLTAKFPADEPLPAVDPPCIGRTRREGIDLDR